MAKRIWIMDGHNMIFQIPPLEKLQVSDRRDEARRGLTERLERFAFARGEKVLVVFDGNELPSNPDAIRKPLFEVVYTRRGEGAADDRIIHEARMRLEQEQRVTVVTDDVSTLAGELPRGVVHLGVQDFWLKYVEKRSGEGSKRVEGDFSEVEREMMAQAAVAESASEVYGSNRTPRVGGPRGAGAPVPPSGPGKEAVASPGAGPQGLASEEESRRERIRLKRDKGRLRQTRRLGRRTKPGRRR